MIKSFLKFHELLRSDKIKLKTSRTNNSLHDYSFFHINEKFDFDNYQIIYEKFIESPIIIIDRVFEENCNSNDGYFIISFKKTLLMINEVQINFLIPLFSKNTNAKYCFLSECQDIFIQSSKLQITQIECDDTFINEEIYNFKSMIYTDISSENMISGKMYDTILTSISGYLIKQSYSKLNDKHDFYIQTNKKPDETVFNEEDFIQLQDIGYGSTFFVKLMYHIDKEELFVMKLTDFDNLRLVEREINNYRRINHPLIPKFYGTIKGKNCLIIEFIKGQTLLNIDEMNLNENDKCTIFWQLLIIFRYIHINEFVYRDLKPNNIIIDESKRVYLIDFDRMIKISEETYTIDFQSQFVSPDVNEKLISYSNDIYSLYKILKYLKINNQQFITFIESNIGQISISEFVKNYYIVFYSKINIDISIIQNDTYVLFNLGALYYNSKYIKQDINKSICCFSLAANKNNLDAQNNLGVIYYEGKYIKQDINKSIYYFSLAANQNDLNAQYNLGLIYYEGKYIKQDINKSIYYFSLAANQNDPKAQYNLGLIYYEGKYIKQDINKSIHYYSLAANQNVPKAQYNLGLIYCDGKYIKQDINKSFYYFLFAANQNVPEAQYLIGFIYYEGKYIKQDINKSIHYYSLAANQNHPNAQIKLGLIYYEGKYVTRDINKSIYYYSLAANQNVPIAQFNLGFIYYKGKYIKQDINKSIHYYSLAADQNYSDALYDLGLFYYEGKYIKQDIYKSIHYFSLAANQNHRQAFYHLGVFYFEDKYTKRDVNKSIHYFSLAANQNHSYAQFILGFIYYFGIYIPKNIKKSLYYIALSSKNGHIEGNFSYGFLLHEGRYIKRNIKEAIHYYKEASSFNNEFAKNNLGIIYKNGFGNEIEERIGNAIEYFEEAIRQKNDYLSMYNLAHIYFYNESIKLQDINKPIELLIKSSDKLNYSLLLLCIVLVKRFGFEITKFEKEIEKLIDIKSEKKAEILQIIYSYNLFNKSNFILFHDKLKKN